MVIEPMPGVVLVKLDDNEFGNIPVPSKPHDSLTYGQVIAVHPEDNLDYGDMVGRIAYWQRYKDDARVTGVKEKLAFIKLEDILGTSYNGENDDVPATTN